MGCTRICELNLFVTLSVEQDHSETPPLAQETKEGKETKETKSRTTAIFDSDEAEADEEVDYVNEDDLVIQELFTRLKKPLEYLTLDIPYRVWHEFAERSYLSNLSEVQQLAMRWGGVYAYVDNAMGCKVEVSVQRLASVTRPSLLHHPRGPFSYHNKPSTPSSDLDEEDAAAAGSRLRRTAIESDSD